MDPEGGQAPPVPLREPETVPLSLQVFHCTLWPPGSFLRSRSPETGHTPQSPY